MRLMFFLTFTLLTLLGVCSEYNGQQLTPDYSGAQDQRIQEQLHQGGFRFLDDYRNSFYEASLFQNELFYTQEFLQRELLVNSQCNENRYKEKSGYIKYLFRLITFSYLYESLLDHRALLAEIDFEQAKECPTLEKITKNCSPKTPLMQDFLDKLAVYEFDKKVAALSLSGWASDYKKTKTQRPSHLSFLTRNTPAKKLQDKKFVTKTLLHSCNENAKFLTLICNEKDNFEGMSYINIPYHLLRSSHAMNVLTDVGLSSDCLKTYSQMSQGKENPSALLKTLFPLTLNYLEQNSPSTKQGRLFFLGSLQEYEKKGLILVKKKQKQPMKKPMMPAKTPLKEISKIKTPKRVEAQKITKKKLPPKTLPKAVKKERKRFSAFQLASETRLKLNLSEVIVDMDQFRFDYIFSNQIKEKIRALVNTFIGRKALEEMKRYDKLGTQKAPMSLVVMKYLIDTKQHHPLFNIQAVLGNEFYIKNDIDKNISKPLQFIRLSSLLDGSWQLYVLAEK